MPKCPLPRDQHEDCCDRRPSAFVSETVVRAAERDPRGGNSHYTIVRLGVDSTMCRARRSVLAFSSVRTGSNSDFAINDDSLFPQDLAGQNRPSPPVGITMDALEAFDFFGPPEPSCSTDLKTCP